MPAQEFFTPQSFDFLWESAGIGEPPYPLRVTSYGETESERSALRKRAEVEFDARRLDSSPVLEWLRILAQPSLSVDALHIPEFQAPTVAALAASDGDKAVLAVQDKDGIWLRPIFKDGLASAVVELLPACARGTESSITLPLESAVRTQPARTGVTTGASSGERSRERRRGGLADRTTDQREAYAQLIAQPRLRGGQLVANSRDELGWKRRSPVLAWFDTNTGRYLSIARPGTDGTEWVTVSPADSKTLRTRLAELVSGVAS